MQHLDTERIAAFDHEAPSPEELVHLAACAVCRAERDAFDALAQWSSQSAAASADASLSPRLSDWESLSKVLRREGLLTSASDHRVAETPLVVRALDGTGERIERSAKVPAVPAAATPSTGRPFPSARQWLIDQVLLARLSYRYYRQEATDYFHEHVRGTPPFHRTQDPDLASFESHGVGLKLAWYFARGWMIDVAGDLVWRSDGLDQRWLGAGVRCEF